MEGGITIRLRSISAKNWSSTLNSLSMSLCLQSWPRLPRNSLWANRGESSELIWRLGIEQRNLTADALPERILVIFTEWKLRKKAPWHCGPSDLLTATGRLADNVTKTFLTLLMQWQSLSLLLTALWAICVTADRVVWPQISWWQSSFVSAAQLYPGLPLFCRWASTFPGYLSTFPMHGFLQRRQVMLDVRESSRSMVLGCSPPLSSPNPAEAGKGTHHQHHYLHMACIHTNTL